MIKSLVKTKVQQFKASAGSLWGQKEAKQIWSQTAWKLGLKPGELYALSDGWASYCVTSNSAKLEAACDTVLLRVS